MQNREHKRGQVCVCSQFSDSLPCTNRSDLLIRQNDDKKADSKLS
jgi:hypothetical protein